MKVSREQVASNRERILELASTLLRAHGIDGVSVADLMKGAGLTHGGFYSYFDSKEDLVAEACGRAVVDQRQRWERLAENSAEPLQAIGQSYLANFQRDRMGEGCPFAALGPEFARHGPAVRRSVTVEVRRVFDLLAGMVPGRSKAARRKKALVAYASMVGGLILARSVDDPDLAAEILQAAAGPLLGSETKGD